MESIETKLDLILTKVSSIEEGIKLLNSKNQEKLTNREINLARCRPWDSNEEENLIKELKEGKTISEISILHKRGIRGTRKRIRLMMKSDVENGQDLAYLSNKFNLPENWIKDNLKIKKIDESSKIDS